MSSQNQVKPTKESVVDHKKLIIAIKEHSTWRDKALNGGIIITNILVQIGQSAPIVGLQHAANAVSTVLTTIEKVQANKKDFKLIADDALDLIIAIWHAHDQAKNPKELSSNGISEIVTDLIDTLTEVNKIALKYTKRNIINRVIFYMADAGKIRQAREKMDAAVKKFQLVYHLRVVDVLFGMVEMMKEQIRDRNEVENMPEDNEGEVEHTSRAPIARAGGSNSARISGFSFSTNGPGTINNQNVGNIVNTTYSGTWPVRAAATHGMSEFLTSGEEIPIPKYFSEYLSKSEYL
ncbi:hypothetical protein BYT27DRAFT_7271112 [Phlegmacium glaucopus]|nr:hypothetical protein BYT27DRAFT_7271112 [Phlegmacium glaucopus]